MKDSYTKSACYDAIFQRCIRINQAFHDSSVLTKTCLPEYNYELELQDTNNPPEGNEQLLQQRHMQAKQPS